MAATEAPALLIPATQAARRLGCSCPVVRNGFGDGCSWDDEPIEGQRKETFKGAPYLVSRACEVHGDDAGKEAEA